MTSSSLWLMSGILAMLKRDGFQPSDLASSTRPCRPSLRPCLGRRVLLLPALRSSEPSVGRACWLTPLSLFRRRRSVTDSLGRLLVCSIRSSLLRLSPKCRAPRFRAIWRCPALCAGVVESFLFLLPLTGLVCLPLRMAGRPGSAPLPPSRSGGRKRFRGGKGGAPSSGPSGSGGRSHHLSGPYPAVVCPSTGRPGGTGVQSHGW